MHQEKACIHSFNMGRDFSLCIWGMTCMQPGKSMHSFIQYGSGFFFMYLGNDMHAAGKACMHSFNLGRDIFFMYLGNHMRAYASLWERIGIFQGIFFFSYFILGDNFIVKSYGNLLKSLRPFLLSRRYSGLSVFSNQYILESMYSFRTTSRNDP